LIAVPTTGTRPLLPLLEEVTAQAHAAGRNGRRVRVVLFDNSHNGSEPARAAARTVGAGCVRVQRRGFAQVRNAALDAADEQDALVFLDDDEWPCPQWLDALVSGAEQLCADVVVGPVAVRLSHDAPRWLAGGALLRPPHEQPDGPLRVPAYSGNTLLRMSTLRRTGVRFKPAFDHSGGEDTEFFSRLSQHRAVFGWVQQASAVELPDPDRLTLRGATRRAYRSGRALGLVEHAVGAWRPLQGGFRRTGRIVRGLLRIVKGAATGHSPDCARGVLDVAFACGWFTSAVVGTGGPGVSGSRSWPSRAT
jgi:hypothetical protein